MTSIRRLLATNARQAEWRIYLSGEIHTEWRSEIAAGLKELPVVLTHPNLSHEDSDDCGAIVLGDEVTRPNYDNKGARMNLIRTKTLLGDADIVVVRFGEKYRQWNAAFEAGIATAQGKSLITLHPPSIAHPLKEVNAGALANCETVQQVVDTIRYTITGELPAPISPDFVPMQQRSG